ncbi:uncharacterized [Tachysurus ichikawai]
MPAGSHAPDSSVTVNMNTTSGSCRDVHVWGEENENESENECQTDSSNERAKKARDGEQVRRLDVMVEER